MCLEEFLVVQQHLNITQAVIIGMGQELHMNNYLVRVRGVIVSNWSDLKDYSYLLENTSFDNSIYSSEGSYSGTYSLETPDSSNASGIYTIGYVSYITNQDATDKVGVRPVIEVAKSDMEY